MIDDRSSAGWRDRRAAVRDGVQPVPEPKTVKNRIHWDVPGERAELVGAGARLLRARGDDIAWDVLADPEGNEFCVFTPGRGLTAR